MHDRPLQIYLSKPKQVLSGQPLILYATGDGGWRGSDRAVFEQMSHWDYPLAGFSSKAYLKNLGYGANSTTPTKLAQDYSRLIASAKVYLGLASWTRTILVGVSRGAGLAVIAAGQKELQPQLAGVLAIGLTKEEESVRGDNIRKGQSPEALPRRESVAVDTYSYLASLSGLPVSVIQSTHDHYLPAGEARKLFGRETGLRQFHAIEASNHTFGGARELLYREMKSSLSWICRLLSVSSPSHRMPQSGPNPGSQNSTFTSADFRVWYSSQSVL
jgi:hypothetical protein